MTLSEGFLELGLKQAVLFKTNPECYLECLVKFPSHQSVMFNVYSTLYSSGKLPSLESQPEEVKQDVWNEAKKLAAGRLTKEKCITLSKCLFCLNRLLEILEPS